MAQQDGAVVAGLAASLYVGMTLARFVAVISVPGTAWVGVAALVTALEFVQRGGLG